MRKLLVLCSSGCSVQRWGHKMRNGNCIVLRLYNLENLFDTIHDAGKNDYEFLPDGSYQ